MMLEKFKFSTKIDVRISDINYGGHLGNDRYLSYFQEGRLRYLGQFGHSELAIGDDTSLIMSRAHIEFKAEAFYGDRLKVFTRISNIRPAKFIFEYVMVDHNDTAKIVATGYTEMVGFDYRTRKVKRLPLQFVQTIAEFENHGK